jgi:5-(carboxyamino)imidazole ribonucleotide mutase
MPTGVPVATVAVNGATNAGLLAVQILSVRDKALCDLFIEYGKDLHESVMHQVRRSALGSEAEKSD